MARSTAGCAPTEACHAGIVSLDELNDRFMAWAESVCNARVHAETGPRPIERFLALGPPRTADLALLKEAFRWSAQRVVTKTATVSLQGNRYQVDAALVGRRVELRYDPEDLSVLSVYVGGLPAGDATAFVIGRHVHPAVPQSKRPDPRPTGIDYLGLVLHAHDQASAVRIAYCDLHADGTDDDQEGGRR